MTHLILTMNALSHIPPWAVEVVEAAQLHPFVRREVMQFWSVQDDEEGRWLVMEHDTDQVVYRRKIAPTAECPKFYGHYDEPTVLVLCLPDEW